jgi:Fe2+ transport system protein FeoA
MTTSMASGNKKSNDQTLFCNIVQKIMGARNASRRDLASFGPPDTTGHIPMPLSCMLPGEQGHVLEIQGDPETRQHLLEMGFTVGTQLDFLRVAPLRDPLTVRIRGYQLSLRRKEADAILVRRCPPEITIDGPLSPDEIALWMSSAARRGE